MRRLLLVESFDFRPSNQYILVRVIPRCFRFAKICLCHVNRLSRCSPRGELHIVYMNEGAHFFSCYVLCYMDRLGFVGFHSPFFKPVLDCM
jgi:hypothetical protein